MANPPGSNRASGIERKPSQGGREWRACVRAFDRQTRRTNGAPAWGSIRLLVRCDYSYRGSAPAKWVQRLTKMGDRPLGRGRLLQYTYTVLPSTRCPWPASAIVKRRAMLRRPDLAAFGENSGRVVAPVAPSYFEEDSRSSPLTRLARISMPGSICSSRAKEYDNRNWFSPPPLA